MTVRVPLTARVYNGFTDTSITRKLRSLRFTSFVPGGFGQSTLQFAEPLKLGSREVMPFTHQQLVDGRSGETVWQGRVEDPGPTTGADGEVWNLVAMGPSARTLDQTFAYVVHETSLANWYQRNRFGAAGRSDVGATPDSPTTSEDALVLTAPGGSVIANGVVAAIYYDVLTRCGQELGGYGYRRVAGKAAVGGDWTSETVAIAESGSPGPVTVSSNNWATAASSIVTRIAGTDFGVGADVLRFNIRRATGATTVVDDVTWGALFEVFVAARRLTKAGLSVTAADYANGYLLASDVIQDLLGRDYLPFDGPSAAIAATSHHIDQMAYPDGVTARDILDDLMALESAYYYAAWEGDPARFEWAAWPTQVAYAASTKDGYEPTSSSVELFNKVAVRWRDKKDRVKVSTYTSTVGTLTDAGLTRKGFVDLSSNMGSQANADRVGANYLADHAYPPNGGTVRLARRVRNLLTGRLEQPWEVRPGRLIRVDGVTPYPDALNATGADGQAVMRVVGTEYDSDSNSVVCELDSYSRALARSLARASVRRR